MRRTAKRLVAMIIGMGGLLVAASPVFSAAGALPDPELSVGVLRAPAMDSSANRLEAGVWKVIVEPAPAKAVMKPGAGTKLVGLVEAACVKSPTTCG